MKQKKSASSNTKIAVIFFVILAFFVGISLIVKIIIVIRAGQYDSSKRFTLSITNGREVEAISINPISKNIEIFKLNNHNVKSTEVGRLLKIPIDGYIESSLLDLNQKISPLFLNAIFKYNSLKTNLTIIDFLKLVMLARTIPENSVNITMVKDADGLISDKVIDNLVSDPLIERDHQTVRIINGTDVVGFGNRLARLITNMGGNVILVVTENNPIKKSTIEYIDKKTYTVERLQKILGYETIKKTKNVMSDVTITIGEDKINSAPF
jgi:hypothetical protein